jgi:hypothetical protein
MIDTQSNIGGFGGNPIPIPVVNTNIYNSDGTLATNRIVTFNGNTLTFLGSKTKIVPSSNLAGDITFGVRDFADTTYNFYVSGNGSVLGTGGFCDLSYSTGVQVNYLRTNTWNDAASTVNLVTWDFGGDGFFKIYKPTKVLSPSASILDTAFAVRNNTDTNSHFQVLGNGSVYSQGKNFGARDTIYGINAGANIGSGAYFLTFFGFQAGIGVTGGACSAFGESAMQGDSTLSSAFGSGALLLGGSSMSAFGVNSARKIGNQRGVFMGNDAGYDIANSTSNILIGWGVAAGITSGNNNVIISGYNVTTPSTLVTSNKNTLLGDRQWDFPSTMKGSIVLGYEAKATADNQFSVGSASENAGAVTTEGFTQALTWTVKINGIDYKIPLQLA